MSSTVYVVIGLMLTVWDPLAEKDPSLWALCMYFILLSDHNFGFVFRKLTDFDVSLSSYQRVITYRDLKPEPDLVLETDEELRKNGWPTQGKIEFKNVHMKYSTSSDSNYILNGLNF